jgi:hypothetical protein
VHSKRWSFGGLGGFGANRRALKKNQNTTLVKISKLFFFHFKEIPWSIDQSDQAGWKSWGGNLATAFGSSNEYAWRNMTPVSDDSALSLLPGDVGLYHPHQPGGGCRRVVAAAGSHLVLLARQRTREGSRLHCLLERAAGLLCAPCAAVVVCAVRVCLVLPAGLRSASDARVVRGETATPASSTIRPLVRVVFADVRVHFVLPAGPHRAGAKQIVGGGEMLSAYAAISRAATLRRRIGASGPGGGGGGRDGGGPGARNHIGGGGGGDGGGRGAQVVRGCLMLLAGPPGGVGVGVVGDNEAARAAPTVEGAGKARPFGERK